MSAPVCLRSVFGACRPSRTAQLPLRLALEQQRNYADKPSQKISGVPKTGSTEERQKILDNVPGKQPPKRPAPLAKDSTSAANTASPVATTNTSSLSKTPPEAESEESKKPRRPVPANVIAAYRAPLKHPAPYGVPVASLQIRSFSIRNLEFFCNFALRAAFYLNLSASGPVPLPKRIERWTVLRSNFINKKAQENFERITLKRLITIMDGEKSAVEVWLAVLRKYQFYGVGMKANVWEYEGIDVASKMDTQAKELQKDVEAKLANFGWNKSVAGSRSLEEMLVKQGERHAGVPMTEVRQGSRRTNPEI